MSRVLHVLRSYRHLRVPAYLLVVAGLAYLTSLLPSVA
jgi:hypothetical protein